MNNKDITPINNKGQKHGYWEIYWVNGDINYIGNYRNGKEYGYSEYYWENVKYLKKYIIV